MSTDHGILTMSFLIAVDLTSRVVVFYFSKIRDRIKLKPTGRTIREKMAMKYLLLGLCCIQGIMF